MDQPGVDPDLHHGALRGLARINRFSGTVGAVWRPLAQLSRRYPGRTLRVLDVASGGGDVAIGLAKRAARLGLPLQVCGCDISQTAVEYASGQARRAGVEVEFFTADVLGQPLPEGFDAICSSLFLHHLDREDAVRLLEGMRAATSRMIVVSDLLRTRLGYGLAWTGCRLLTRNPLCRVDGPLSVEGAFSLPEVVDLAAQCQLQDATIRKQWPERFLMTWETFP
ncbi:methyltransferase domain-containing protein [Roseimaritima ulvae]|uniref:Methyltransferase domain-containing protein n=1 Tax=Roseimaritima ulvae TaxID=980254 RepID=A0A5B9QW58_9BACT|nr:methyltransferase domain-containing protein [Roseimaritima ulvae]QEG42020.1 hypothetical protein UC8_40490 [Roseimaritima ulvae]